MKIKNLKNYFKEVNTFLKFEKSEKLCFFKSFIINIFYSLATNVLPLFLTFSITLFETHRLLASILLLIYLLRETICKVITSICSIYEKNISNILQKSEIKFKTDILERTQNRVYIEDDGVKKILSNNNILDVLGGYYVNLERVLSLILKIGIYLISYVVAFIGVYSSVSTENISAFNIILVLFLIINVILLVIKKKKMRKNHEKESELTLKNSNNNIDLVYVKPLNNKHHEYLVNNYLKTNNELLEISKDIEKTNCIIELIANFIRSTSLIVIIALCVLADGIDNITVEKILFAISISAVLDNLISNISLLLDKIFLGLEDWDYYLEMKKKFDIIYEVYKKDKELKEFKEEKLLVPNFKFKYPTGEFTLISKNPITISRGELVLLKGQSGAGKSTFINIISGDIGQLQEYKIKSLGYFNDKSSIGSNSLLSEIVLDDDIKQIDAKLEEILIGLRLDDKINENNINVSFKEMVSNGMKQRLLLARLLYNLDDSDLICIDEPIGSLDEENAKKVINFIKKYCNRDKKRFILISTHQYQMIRDEIDKVVEIIPQNNNLSLVKEN